MAAKARDARIKELIRRMRLLGAAHREAVLASQACHASALVVAVDVGLRDNRGIERATAAERALVTTMTRDARGADQYLAVATAIAALLDGAVRARQRTELIVGIASQFADVVPGGGWDSNVERPWIDASRWITEIGALREHSRRSREHARRGRPVAIGGTPTIANLVRRRQDDPAKTATSMLTGLWASDLGAVIDGAAPLHGNRSPARLALLSAARAHAGDFVGALRAAQRLVPLDSDVARMLVRARTAMEPSRKTAEVQR
jgi:hypothetical protein